MMQKIMLIKAIVLSLLNISAQTLNDPIYIHYSQLPETDFDNTDGNIAANFFEFNATAPAVNISKKRKLFNAVYYRNSNFNYSSLFPQNNLFPTTLHDIRYSAIIRIPLNTRWELVALPRIMVRSDLNQSISSKDFFPQQQFWQLTQLMAIITLKLDWVQH